MSDRRRFPALTPDWGEAHLTVEAVVAYVDDELAAGPSSRATRHLERCPSCAGEVAEQRRARSALRGANAPTTPLSLMDALRSIPQETELPPPPAGLSLTADGEMVSVLRPDTLGGAPRRTSSRSRRVRLGTGAAVSGLAIGALAFGLPAVTSSASAPAPGGPATGGAAVARFAATPTMAPRQRPTSAMPAPDAPGSQGTAPDGGAGPEMTDASLPPAGR